MRFLGNIEAKTDAKGRVFLPATFRKQLQAAGEEMLVMRKDIHQKCLVLYPESVWNQRVDALRERVNEWDDESQMVMRQYMKEAEVIALDGNGRFLIRRDRPGGTVHRHDRHHRDMGGGESRTAVLEPGGFCCQAEGDDEKSEE